MEKSEDRVTELRRLYTIEKLNEVLFDADKECEHELDPKNYSGIKCKHCGGWFCY